jgi:acetoin utilization deacetylase AcuC-like enzyme
MGRTLVRRLRRAWFRLRPARIPAVYSARYREGRWAAPFDPLRGEKVLGALDEMGVLSPHSVSEPRAASIANLLRVHEAHYLRSLQDGERLGRILGGPVARRDVESVLDLQRLMVGGTIQATRLAIRTGGVAAHLGGGFHHAFAGAGMGFCVFNDVAVAIARLRARGYAERILVVDLDLHDGNGTRAIFSGDPSVYTFSIHNDHWGETDVAASTSIALGSGVTDEVYLETLRQALPPVVADFKPGFVFYVAGTDVAEGDALGNWRLSAKAVLGRDRLVTDLVRPRPLVVVLGGGYGPHAWRHTARYLLWLASGRELELPGEEELTLARMRHHRAVLGRGADGDLPFSLSEEDLAVLSPRDSQPRRFMGAYSRQDVELQLETFGILPQLRARGFTRVRVELDAGNGQGETVRVLGEDGAPEDLLVELRARRSRSAVPGFELLAVEWLLLQNPRASFSPERPRLPGQQHPGLGLLKDVLGWLVLACEEHALDGVFFVAAHYHIAIQSRRLVRLLRPEDEARVRALDSALAGLGLAEASRAMAEGRVRSEAGEPFRWEPAACVVPVSPRLRERVSGAEYEEALARAAEHAAYQVRSGEPAATGR